MNPPLYPMTLGLYVVFENEVYETYYYKQALWSQPGEVVFSPFAGIGSEVYGSLLLGRKFVGAELKREYVYQAITNLNRAVRLRKTESVSLFANYETATTTSEED